MKLTQPKQINEKKKDVELEKYEQTFTQNGFILCLGFFINLFKY